MREYDLKSLKPILVMLVTAVMSVMVFLALYKYNNKYTIDARQATAGVLDLSRQAADISLHSLVEEWEFYPGELLEPKDFDHGDQGREVYYVSIGRFAHMGAETTTKWIQGTFRMTILLPDSIQTYALELPEIPVSSRTFVQGNLVLQRGDPDSGETGIGSDVIYLTEQGQVEILIQAADLRSLHRSMFAPPVFGSSQEVMRIRSLGILIRTVILVIAVCSAVLSLNLAAQIRWWRGYLFFLLCLSFVGYSLWPLLRTMTPLGLQPWYAVHLFSFHAMLWLAVILENDLYRIKGGRVSVAMGVFCILFLLYGCYVQYVPIYFSTIVSYFMEWYKYAVAFYLIMVANTALVERMEYSQSLLVMAVVFTSTLFMEQVLPYYEPVMGSPFMMVGSCALMAGMLRILWSDMVDAFHTRTVFIYETSRMTRQLSVQREHYQQLNVKIGETRRLRHDLRHHLRTLHTLADQGSMGELKGYLEQLAPTIQSQELMTYTSNYALDALLCHYSAAAKQEGIETNVQVELPPQLLIPDDELCVLFGNLMENAVEACRRQESGKKFLYLRARQDKNRFSIVLDNSYNGIIRYSEGYFSSSKRDGVGIGVESVKAIVKKNRGIADFTPEGEVFRVSILIPL